MRSALLIGANPADRNRLLKISAAASRIQSRFGWPVRLSNGSTSRIRPLSAADVPLCPSARTTPATSTAAAQTATSTPIRPNLLAKFQKKTTG
jgi:hypothetical protein